MYTANVFAFSKGTDAAKWIGLVVAVLGVALLFTDLAMNIKKRNHTKMNVVALVFLSLSLVCYILTQWVIQNLPTLFGFIWVVFLVAYFVCDIVMAIGIGRDNRRKKLGIADADEDDAERSDDESQDKDAEEKVAEADEKISDTEVSAKPSGKSDANKKDADNVALTGTDGHE
ncbi:MAG: hypothetical protein NC132_06405 [Corallococcus sp.]|nr:hypothetical protein [Corallococcus sp.]MCM1359759.1 hypothetical protein [Corallococcus sp.]MCM1395715.1 hypothetical protein [Corallococcus sp.]